MLSEEIIVTDRLNALKISSEKIFVAISDFQYAPYSYYSAPSAFSPSHSRGHRGRSRGWKPSFTKSYNSFHSQYVPPSYYSPRQPPPQGWLHPQQGWSPIPTAQRPPIFAQASTSLYKEPCQLCLKPGHLAPTCYQRFNFAY